MRTKGREGKREEGRDSREEGKKRGREGGREVGRKRLCEQDARDNNISGLIDMVINMHVCLIVVN